MTRAANTKYRNRLSMICACRKRTSSGPMRPQRAMNAAPAQATTRPPPSRAFRIRTRSPMAKKKRPIAQSTENAPATPATSNCPSARIATARTALSRYSLSGMPSMSKGLRRSTRRDQNPPSCVACSGIALLGFMVLSSSFRARPRKRSGYCRPGRGAWYAASLADGNADRRGDGGCRCRQPVATVPRGPEIGKAPVYDRVQLMLDRGELFI